MRAPGIATRISCAVVGAVAAPIAVGLVSTGGTQWARMRLRYGYSDEGLPFDRLAGPTLLMLLGLILLIGVVLTGLFSAAGLIAAGVVGVAALIGTLAPGAALSLVKARFLPSEALGQLYAGVPAAVLPLLGLMGVTLLTVRRVPPREGLGSRLLGALVALVALTLGGGLLMWGVQLGVGRALKTFDTEFLPLPALLVLGAIALIGVGTMASRWSPFALTLPAVALLVLGVVNMFSFALLRFPLREIAQPTTMFLFYGGGVAVAAAQLAFTVVLLVQRRRIRRLDDTAPAGAVGAPATIGRPGTSAASDSGAGPHLIGGPGVAANIVPAASSSAVGSAHPQAWSAQRLAPAPPTPPAPPAS